MELPVKPKDKCNYTNAAVIEIIDADGVFIAEVRNVETRDYIVQVINSYEKFKIVVQDLVNCATKYPDDYATKDLNKLIPFVIKEAKQALKEKP